MVVPVTSIENNDAQFLGNGAICDFPEASPSLNPYGSELMSSSCTGDLDACEKTDDVFHPTTKILDNNYISPLHHLDGGGCDDDGFVLCPRGVEGKYHHNHQTDSLHKDKTNSIVPTTEVGRPLLSSSFKAPASTYHNHHEVCLESFVDHDHDHEHGQDPGLQLYVPANVISPSFSTFVVGSACGEESPPPPGNRQNHVTSLDMILVASGPNLMTCTSLCTWNQQHNGFQQQGLQPAVAADLVRVFDG